MALPHAQSGQIVSVRPLGDRLPEAVTAAILKAGQLEVMRVVLPAGKSMKEHQTPGEATVQCLEGVVEFTTEDGNQQLHPGDFVHLAPPRAALAQGGGARLAAGHDLPAPRLRQARPVLQTHAGPAYAQAAAASP